MSVTQSACARSHAGRPMAGKDAHGKGRDATGLKDGRRHLGKGAAVVVPCTERRPQALDLSATVDRGASLAVVVINYDKEIQRVAAIVGSAVACQKGGHGDIEIKEERRRAREDHQQASEDGPHDRGAAAPVLCADGERAQHAR